MSDAKKSQEDKENEWRLVREFEDGSKLMRRGSLVLRIPSLAEKERIQKLTTR